MTGPTEPTTRTCRACGLPETDDNPLYDFRHDQNCEVYLASGACRCGTPGYVAHRYRCPVFVEGDKAPKKKWMH